MIYILFALFFAIKPSFANPAPEISGRIASIYLSETFINEQLSSHLENSDIIKELKASFDPSNEKIFLRGRMQLPMDDIDVLGIDPKLLQFNFQLTVKPSISQGKYLVLEFPLEETFFYQSSSKNPKKDRIIIPMQLLSLGIASTRGYLAALSGNFSTFDRKREKLNALLQGIKRNLATETNPDAKAALVRERKSLELKLASANLEREKFEHTSNTLTKILGFSKKDELNLNDEIRARENALMLRMKLKNIVPYLKNVELGDIKLGRNGRDGMGESYFILHLNSKLTQVPPVNMKVPFTPKDKFKAPPALSIRLNQSIFTTEMIAETEKEKIASVVKDFNISFRDDGIHLTGKVKKFFFNIPFDALVDFVHTGADLFEVRLRQLQVFKMDLKFLTPYALKAIEARLNSALGGICEFKYLGKKGNTKALQVKIDSSKLIPAFPYLHLVDVRVKDQNFLLRIGRTE
jgi:hypothetical protein